MMARSLSSIPIFLGINSSTPYQCELVSGNPWLEIIRDSACDKLIKKSEFHDRVHAVVKSCVKSIETPSTRDPKPHIILCCIPQQVIDACTIKVGHEEATTCSRH